MDSASGASKGSKSGKTSGGASTLDAGEDSESESESSSSSSSSSNPKNISKELESFRMQWKAELKKVSPTTAANKNERKSMTEKISHRARKNKSTPPENSNEGVKVSEESSSKGGTSANSGSYAYVSQAGNTGEGSAELEEQAKNWFIQGIGFERKGELYDAVRCYRRAIQLVPDIERRVSSMTMPANPSEASSSVGTPHESDVERDSDVEDEADDGGPLTVKFLRLIEENGWSFFLKAKEDNRVHLSDLPVEVLSYILRWVVSNDLDVRSLDILSNACRGFYCLCRDEKLWQMACEKVWTDVSELESESGYSSFREMFLKRPRVRFDGCYICKVSYIRPGEQSFQDQSYRPWHFVEYYRYIRFLPNGELLVLTTSDEPNIGVGGLRDAKYPRNPATLRGHYELYGDNIVSAVVKKGTPAPETPVFRGRGSRVQTHEITTFRMEFEITPVRGRANWMLKWMHYAVYITRCTSGSSKVKHLNQMNNNTTVSSTFDLNPAKFPPLCFSRVKSYTQKSEGIL